MMSLARSVIPSITLCNEKSILDAELKKLQYAYYPRPSFAR